MKKHEGILLIGVIAVFAVIIIILLFGGNKDQQQAQTTTPSQSGQTQTTTTTSAKVDTNKIPDNLENAKLVNDYQKLNTSTKLQETKTINGLEINNVQLTSKDNVTTMLATVTNKTNQTAGNFAVKLSMLDKDGNTITEAHGYINKLDPGQTTQLNISKTFDFANAHDYTITAE